VTAGSPSQSTVTGVRIWPFQVPCEPGYPHSDGESWCRIPDIGSWARISDGEVSKGKSPWSPFHSPEVSPPPVFQTEREYGTVFAA